MKVRDYQEEDQRAMVDMLAADDATLLQGIERAFEVYRFLVADEGGTVKGFAATHEENPGDWDLRVYAHPAHRRRGIGRLLYEAAMTSMRGSGAGEGRLVTVRYRADQGEGRDFFARRGFAVWYAMDELVYEGPRMPEPTPGRLEIRPYDDRCFEGYMRMVGDAFEPTRRLKDFRPHNVFEKSNTPQRRRELEEKHAGDIFLGFDVQPSGDEELVGAADVERDFIDEVAVSPAHQGKGYGKALTMHCVNLLIDRGLTPRTSVLVDNEPARSMYYRLGFRLLQTNEWARRPLAEEPTPTEWKEHP